MSNDLAVVTLLQQEQQLQQMVNEWRGREKIERDKLMY